MENCNYSMLAGMSKLGVAKMLMETEYIHLMEDLQGQMHHMFFYVSNYSLDNVNELNRELEAFNRICDADPNAINALTFHY